MQLYPSNKELAHKGVFYAKKKPKTKKQKQTKNTFTKDGNKILLLSPVLKKED